jgi:GWxTD domain-containing protein
MQIQRSVWLLASVAALLLVPAELAMAQEGGGFADNAMEVSRYFEGDDAELADWDDGPVDYIMLDYERDEWKKLDSEEHRRQFIGWFWGRRDLDGRDDTQEFRGGFYQRVAHANQRYREFPRGWRSDRGRVFVTLGPPSGGARRISLVGYGRCNAEYGEQWIYYTSQMANVAGQFGEFQVLFVENGPSQFEICEPSMMGIGGWPLYVMDAMEVTNTAVVVDNTTEFLAGRAAGRATVAIKDVVARTEALEVPLAEWGNEGVAGTVLVPIELPLRDLLFEPGGASLIARLVVDVRMVAMGANEGPSERYEWAVEVGPEDAQAIAGGSLRTAIALPAPVGGYSVQARVLEPISGTAWTWEGPLEVRDDGTSVSPPLVGGKLLRLRADGEIATLGRATGRLTQGEPFSVVSWVRGFVPLPEDVKLAVMDAAGNEIALEGLQIDFGDGGGAGPLVIQAVAPSATPGEYILRLETGQGAAPVETRIRIE